MRNCRCVLDPDLSSEASCCESVEYITDVIGDDGIWEQKRPSWSTAVSKKMLLTCQGCRTYLQQGDRALCWTLEYQTGIEVLQRHRTDHDIFEQLLNRVIDFIKAQTLSKVLELALTE